MVKRSYIRESICRIRKTNLKKRVVAALGLLAVDGVLVKFLFLKLPVCGPPAIESVKHCSIGSELISDGADCLDLYAGTGILGLEALSRGASTCTALENNPTVSRQLHANCDELGADLSIINADSIKFLQHKNSGRVFDIVFVDPPFSKTLHTKSCALLESNGWLAPDALIYCELPATENLFATPPSWRIEKDKIASGVRYMLYSRIESGA